MTKKALNLKDISKKSIYSWSSQKDG